MQLNQTLEICTKLPIALTIALQQCNYLIRKQRHEVTLCNI